MVTHIIMLSVKMINLRRQQLNNKISCEKMRLYSYIQYAEYHISL